ncbi:MAG: hypothetical protein ACPGSD_16010 [Flavobacteriales bacterium]
MRKISGTILLLFLSLSLSGQEYKVNEIPIVKPKLFKHPEQKIKYNPFTIYYFLGSGSPIGLYNYGVSLELWRYTELTDCWWFQDCNNRDEK